jgi:hypothetical protein
MNKSYDWIVISSKSGEVSFCKRCGMEGKIINAKTDR